MFIIYTIKDKNMQHKPKRPRSSKHRLINELQKESNGLKKLLEKIKKNGGKIGNSAEHSIHSIDDLVQLINNSNIDKIDEIVVYALDN